MMNDSLELLKELIRCKPVSDRIDCVNRAESVMRNYLESKGLYCVTEQIDGRSVLYASTLPGKVQDILLNAHLDVVPAPDEMFEPVEKDGRLYARGSADCLGNAVCIAEILCRCAGKASVSAFFTADEEIGGSTTAAMVERGYAARKMVLILDAAPYSIAHAQKGILTLTLRAHGKGGHSSEPWRLDNPIDRLVDGYVKLREAWPPLPHDSHWGNTMAPCILRAGSVSNQVPDTAEMLLNIRYISEEDGQRIPARIREITGLEVISGMTSSPVFVDESHPMMQKLKQAMEIQFPDHPISFCRMDGATDARHFVKLGVPVAILGTCGDGMHSSGEWAELQSLRDYADLLTAFLTAEK